MKNIAALLAAAFVSAAFIHVRVASETNGYNPGRAGYKNTAVVRCSPDAASLDFSDPANRIPLLSGWGDYRMPVSHAADSAYQYFQQGINMYYGFHIIEALASFERATELDSNFAMAYWGKALAYGPNINDLGYAASPDALAATTKAVELSGNCTPLEKALVAAMALRYSPDSTDTRQLLNQRYADAMKAAVAGFPKSADVAALYADALMVQHPWDLYDVAYEPKPWTPAIVRVLEQLVAQYPRHPGANHYYIHAVEGSAHPEKAVKVADRLGAFMPGVSHLVHMPSHIYIRSGLYAKGMEANEAALKGYAGYMAQYPPVANGTFFYRVHNIHMSSACAAMGAAYNDAAAFSLQVRNSIDSPFLSSGGYFGMYAQYLYMTPVFTQIRFGKWGDVLGGPALPEGWVYARSMQHFARGLAFARGHQPDQALREWEQMDDSSQNAVLQDHPAAFNPGIAAVEVARRLLQGVVLQEQGNLAGAVRSLQEAVDLEDRMLYNEPKDWVLPVRHFLGHALLQAGKPAEAEQVYRKDLQVNPNNAWALTGLSQALRQQSKNQQAVAVEAQAKKALAGSGLVLNGSVL